MRFVAPQLAALLLLVPIYLHAADAPLPAVTVQTVAETELTPSFRLVGRVEATARVDLTARVSGLLQERLFQEGRPVKKGDVLFNIERESYDIQVAQAKADLASARASLKNAQASLSRSQRLRKSNAIPKAELDSAVAARDQAKAQVMKAEALLRNAQLNLSYTTISSPIDGHIGKANLSIGNLVGPNTGALATVVSMDPIYVSLAVSEKLMIEARRQGIRLEAPPVAPSLTLADGSEYAHAGEFNFVSPEVDQNTDTITVRATFPNPDGVLLPGEFVSVSVKHKNPTPVIAIPQAAIQKDREGYFVLAVDRENQVSIRRVNVGEQNNGLWIVSTGLMVGDRIVTEGIQKARPGSTVNAVEQ